MAHGSHIMLDCTGAVGIDGDWMLALMEKALMLQEQGGYILTSRVLTEQSLHRFCFCCILMRATLALTAILIPVSCSRCISCGNTDPARIIEVVESEIKKVSRNGN